MQHTAAKSTLVTRKIWLYQATVKLFHIWILHAIILKFTGPHAHHGRNAISTLFQKQISNKVNRYWYQLGRHDWGHRVMAKGIKLWLRASSHDWVHQALIYKLNIVHPTATVSPLTAICKAAYIQDTANKATISTLITMSISLSHGQPVSYIDQTFLQTWFSHQIIGPWAHNWCKLFIFTLPHIADGSHSSAVVSLLSWHVC